MSTAKLEKRITVFQFSIFNLQLVVVRRGAGPGVNKTHSFIVPGKISLAGGVEYLCGGILILHLVNGSCALPLSYLCMSVSKGKPACPIVVRSRNVLPVVLTDRVIDEITIVDGIGVFVEEQPGLRGPDHLALFEVLTIL